MMRTKIYNTANRMRWIAVFGVIAIFFSACSTTSNLATSEYDDIYYSSSDVTNESPSRDISQRSYDERDDYEASRYGTYDEDDFYYSRRIRRFNQPNYNAWRYYDPFFTNDLYFVMNTPFWNRWNNRGWYSWTRPRFGASVAFSFGDPFIDPFYSPLGVNSFGYMNSLNYYNPWVRNYYGFDPFFGYRGLGVGNPWAYNTGFYDGYAYAWNGCPPGAYSSTSTWRTFNVARRANTTSLASQTSYQGRTPNNERLARPTTSTTSSERQARRPNTYLTPKTTAEKNARVDDDFRRNLNARAADYDGRRSSNAYSRDRNSNSNANSRNTRTYRRPTSEVDKTRRTDNSRQLNRKPTTRPSTDLRRSPTTPTRSSTPSYNRRPNTNSSPRMSRPSSSSRPSYSRPSSSTPSSSRSSSPRRPQ